MIRLACVMALSLIGGAAGAATVQKIALELGFAGHSYFDVTVQDGSIVNGTWVPGAELFSGARLDQINDQWGMPRLFSETPGQRLAFSAQIALSDTGGTPSLISCRLGAFDCGGATGVEITDSSFNLFYGSEIWLRGGLQAGSAILFDYFPGTFSQALTTSGDLATWSVLRGNFDVLGTLPEVAPVPLPASGVLLVMGLTGLGVLRRKQRRS